MQYCQCTLRGILLVNNFWICKTSQREGENLWFYSINSANELKIMVKQYLKMHETALSLHPSLHVLLLIYKPRKGDWNKNLFYFLIKGKSGKKIDFIFTTYILQSITADNLWRWPGLRYRLRTWDFPIKKAGASETQLPLQKATSALRNPNSEFTFFSSKDQSRFLKHFPLSVPPLEGKTENHALWITNCIYLMLWSHCVLQYDSEKRKTEKSDAGLKK